MNMIKLFLGVVLVAAVAVTFFLTDNQKKEVSVSEDQNLIALSGVVTSVDGNAITFKTGYFQQDEDGNELVEQEKKVNITDSTKIYLPDEVTEADLINVVVDSTITIYIHATAVPNMEVTTEKIIIN